MRRSHSLSVALIAALLSGGAALGDAYAQERPGQPRDLRYISWPGRAAAPAEAAASDAAPARADQRRPNRVIPHGGSRAADPEPRPGLTPAPGAGRTLTPANAWLRPRPAASEPAPPPPPASAPAPAASAPRTTPDFLPDQGGRGQPAPADIAFAQPVPAEPVAGPMDADPMAPRRDAPIFRMQAAPEVSGPAPAQAEADPGEAERPADARAPQPRRVAMVASNPDDRPPAQGARYYSVHRQNGREPDALTMPQPTYVDAMAITVPETPASQDLAEPERGPALVRDAQGRVRAQPAAPAGGDYE